MQACAYVARVRVRARAGETIVVREGSGAGNGAGATRGEAHESAIKEAETDAMKRAFATFGNPFGLALYDKDQVGVRQSRPRSAVPISGGPVVWVVFRPTGEPDSEHKDPVAYCSAIKKRLIDIDDAGQLKSFWARNKDIVTELERQLPDLKNEKRQHYGEILGALYTARLRELATRKKTLLDDPEGTKAPPPLSSPPKPSETNTASRRSKPAKVVNDAAAIGPYKKGPHRIRDKAHLEFVASKNCMVCGRFPSQAHHVRFAQPRALGRKVSDEWVVPLCAIHHRALHDFGNEEKWWEQQKLDPIKEAQQLWRLNHKEQHVG